MEVGTDMLWEALIETLYMVGVSLLFGSLIAVPLGVLLVVTRQGHILENRFIYSILNPVVNIMRSIPFIILLIAIIPFTRLLVGTSIGTQAAIVPLVLHIGPYMSRLIENSLLEVKPGIVEAARSMGAHPLQIIMRFLLPEAFPSIVLSITIGTIGLVGATAMAGAIGSGGLGNLALTYGYQRFSTITIVVVVIILVIIVQVLQMLGNTLERKLRH